jgi:hypothetical protein
MSNHQRKTYSPPASFELDTETRTWAEKQLPGDLLEDELAKFRAWGFYADRNNWNFAARKWLQRAIDRHKATTTLDDTEDAREQRMLRYTSPSAADNPGGNPHGVRLPELVAQRRQGELIENYESRIAVAVTQAKYGASAR